MKKARLFMLIVLLSFPFFQGGYFDFEILFFGSLIMIILLLTIVNKVQEPFLNPVQDSTYIVKTPSKKHQDISLIIPHTGVFYLYLGFFFISLVTWAVAVDKGLHLFLVLRLLVFLVFVYVFRLLEINVKNAGYGIVISGLMIGVVGIMGLLFAPLSRSFIDYQIQRLRFGGLFQYANTYGIFLFSVLIILNYFARIKYCIIKNTRVNRLVYISAIAIFVTNIQLTQSRLSLIVLLIYSVYFFIWEKGYRLNYTVGLVIGLVLGELGFWYLDYNGLYLLNGIRYTQISTGESEWLTRLLYYKDALSMIINRPSGYGHLGYYYLQRIYQTGTNYHVKYVHNGLLQAFLDLGFFGGLLFCFVLIKIIINGLKGLIKHNDTSALSIGLMGVGVHTLVDFDLQFAVIHILMILIWWMINESKGVSSRIIYINKKRISLLSILGLCVLMYFSIVALLDYNHNYDWTLRLYPAHTEAMNDRIKDLDIDITENEKVVTEWVESHPYSVRGFAFLRDYYYNDGSLEKSSLYSKKIVELIPLNFSAYEEYIEILYIYLLEQLDNDQLYKNNSAFDIIFASSDYMNLLESTRNYNYTIRHKVDFQLTEKMQSTIKHTELLYRLAK